MLKIKQQPSQLRIRFNFSLRNGSSRTSYSTARECRRRKWDMSPRTTVGDGLRPSAD